MDHMYMDRKNHEYIAINHHTRTALRTCARWLVKCRLFLHLVNYVVNHYKTFQFLKYDRT